MSLVDAMKSKEIVEGDDGERREERESGNQEDNLLGGRKMVLSGWLRRITGR